MSRPIFGILRLYLLRIAEGALRVTLTGIIDIGSNSMRLSVIRELEDGGHYVVDEQKSSPRLANRITPEGRLSPAGIEELLEHLKEFRGLCDAYGATRIVALGTAALREAANRSEIVLRIRETLHMDVEIVSGIEEATLGYSAVMHTLAVDTAYLVDIGGGSTEITLVVDGRRTESFSLPFGAVTVARRWADAPAEGWFERLPDLDRALGEVPFLSDRPGAEVIGIGGTIRNIARVHQAQTGYPLPLTHNYEMSGDSVASTVDWLAQLPLARRKKVDGLSKERADLIVPGGAILVSLLRRVRARTLRVSGRGLRDGAFYTRVLGQPLGPGSRWAGLQNSVHNTLTRYQAVRGHASHVAELAAMLYRDLAQSALVPAGVEPILYTAAMLHRIGVQVNYYNYDQHTFYLVLNSPIYGLTHREIVISAAAASFKGRGRLRRLCAPYRTLIDDAGLMLAAQLGVIVRLAEALDRRHERRIPALTAQSTGLFLDLWVPPDADAEVETAAALTFAPHVKKVFGKTLRIGT